MRTIILFILTFISLNIYSQGQLQTLVSFRTTVEPKWVLHHRSDTVILEPVYINVGVEVSMNCDTTGKTGLCFRVFDTEQQCIDYIEDNSLVSSKHSLEANIMKEYPYGYVITNHTDFSMIVKYIKDGKENLYSINSGEGIVRTELVDNIEIYTE